MRHFGDLSKGGTMWWRARAVTWRSRANVYWRQSRDLDIHPKVAMEFLERRDATRAVLARVGLPEASGLRICGQSLNPHPHPRSAAETAHDSMH